MGFTNGSTVHLDPSGDLTLFIGEATDTQATAIVSSRAICLASPIWRAMLNPDNSFKESNPANQEITFPEDDAEAFMILLNIAHLQFLNVPSNIENVRKLLNIAILCDKYDTVTLVRPWLPRWNDVISSIGRDESFEERLFISWTFGDVTTFESITAALVKCSTTDETGQCLYYSGIILEHNMPLGVVGECVSGFVLFLFSAKVLYNEESILEARQIALKLLLQLCYDFIDHFEVNNCRASSQQEMCNSMILGSRILELKKVGFWPQRMVVSKYKASVLSLAMQLLQFSSLGPLTTQHHYCNGAAQFQECVRRELACLPSGMSSSHRAHLTAQQKK